MDYLYFIHVPRTGGTFATRVLAEALGPRFVREGHTVPAGLLRPWHERWGPEHFSSVPRESCTVFTVVRNPFDMLVSMYMFCFPYWGPRYANQRAHMEWPFRSFREFVRKLCEWDDYPWIFPPQKKSLYFQLFDLNGRFLPDHVLRQEELTAGLRALLRTVGAEVDIPGQRVNRSHSADYRDFYDNELVALVERRFAGDLQALGYSFDGHDGRAFFRLEGVRFDHLSGRYDGLQVRDASPRSVPSGALTDVDMHPWGREVLSRFTGRQLTEELASRLLRRAGLHG